MKRTSAQRETDLARALDFRSAYQRRKFNRLVREGVMTHAQRTDFIEAEAAKIRVRAEQRERDKRDFVTDYQRRKYYREVAEGKRTERSRSAFVKDATLKYFGITPGRLAKIRLENLRFQPTEYASLYQGRLNTYDREVDSRENDFSRERIGYIIAFHAAVVNPRTNYDSITARVDPKKIDKTKYKLRGLRAIKYEYDPMEGTSYRKTNSAQYWYLVHYAPDRMTIEEFESRYGMTQTRTVSSEPLKP